jgi:30S ribosomal protein 3
LQATAEDEVIDLAQVTLAGPSSAVDTPAEEVDLSLEELAAAAEATHLSSLAVADIEAAFLEGTGDEELSGYLSALQAEADALQLSGKGAAADAALTPLAAAADELLESGDVPEAAVLESLGVATGPAERDVLEGLPNEEALQARQVVAALKLNKQELAEHILPEDWDATTTDWFTNKDEEDTPLPEYKLVFLWMDKNIAVGVDQVYARGNSSPLTEYFVWPRKDAWEELKLALEARPWISDLDKVGLLNRLTEVINFWMGDPAPDGTPQIKRSIEEARAQFPDCSFAGTL